MSKPQILLVEDDERAGKVLVRVLERGGYVVVLVPDGETAIAHLAQPAFDVVVTDLRMRAVDGIQVLQATRRLPSPPEVIILTGHGSLATAIAALRMGAYDYLLKPCAPEELLMTVAGAVERRAVVIRQATAIETIGQGIAQLRSDLLTDAVPAALPLPLDPLPRHLHVGALTIDRFLHTVTFHDQHVHVTPIEYALLCCLAEAQGRVLDDRAIVQQTHGYATDPATARRLLKSHVRNLRRKIDPTYLVSLHGIGYVLMPPGPTE